MARVYTWGPQFHAVANELLEQGVRIIIFVDADQMATELLSIQWLIPDEVRKGKISSDIHVLAFARSTCAVPALWPIESWCTWFHCQIDTKNAADLALTMAIAIFHEREISYRERNQYKENLYNKYPKEFARYVVASMDNFGGNAVSTISAFPECRAYEYYDRSYDLSVIICLDALEYQDVKLSPQSEGLKKYLLKRIAIITSGNWEKFINCKDEFIEVIKNIPDKYAVKNLMEKAKLCARYTDEVIILRNIKLKEAKSDINFIKLVTRAICEAGKDPSLVGLKLNI